MRPAPASVTLVASALWPGNNDLTGDTMAHRQIPAENSVFLLQAKDFLIEARRLKPGPARNELREVAKVLRELAEFEIERPSVARAWRAGSDRAFR